MLEPFPNLAAQGQVRRSTLVERDELQALEEGGLRSVAEEAVVLLPPNDVELLADRARPLLAGRGHGGGCSEKPDRRQNTSRRASHGDP